MRTKNRRTKDFHSLILRSWLSLGAYAAISHMNTVLHAASCAFRFLYGAAYFLTVPRSLTCTVMYFRLRQIAVPIELLSTNLLKQIAFAYFVGFLARLHFFLIPSQAFLAFFSILQVIAFQGRRYLPWRNSISAPSLPEPSGSLMRSTLLQTISYDLCFRSWQGMFLHMNIRTFQPTLHESGNRNSRLAHTLRSSIRIAASIRPEPGSDYLQTGFLSESTVLPSGIHADPFSLPIIHSFDHLLDLNPEHRHTFCLLYRIY